MSVLPSGDVVEVGLAQATCLNRTEAKGVLLWSLRCSTRTAPRTRRSCATGWGEDARVLEISLQTSHNFKMLRHQPADSRPSAGCRLLRCDAGSESLINMLPLKLPIKLTRSLWLDHTTRRVSDNRLKYVSLAVKFKQNISKRFRKCCVD